MQRALQQSDRRTEPIVGRTRPPKVVRARVPPSLPPPPSRRHGPRRPGPSGRAAAPDPALQVHGALGDLHHCSTAIRSSSCNSRGRSRARPWPRPAPRRPAAAAPAGVARRKVHGRGDVADLHVAAVTSQPGQAERSPDGVLAAASQSKAIPRGNWAAQPLTTATIVNEGDRDPDPRSLAEGALDSARPPSAADDPDQPAYVVDYRQMLDRRCIWRPPPRSPWLRARGSDGHEVARRRPASFTTGTVLTRCSARRATISFSGVAGSTLITLVGIMSRTQAVRWVLPRVDPQMP